MRGSMCVVIAKASFRPVGVAALLAVATFHAAGRLAAQQGPRPPSPGEISSAAQQVFNRMRDEGAVEWDTAVAGYVSRTYAYVSEADDTNLRATLRKGIENAQQIRIKNMEAVGIKPNLAAIKKQTEANIAEAIAANSHRGDQTIAVRYWQAGKSYRAEQFPLPNDVSLSDLAQRLKTGEIEFKPTFTRTWNGKQYAELSLMRPAETAKTSPRNADRRPAAIAAIAFENRGALPKFMSYAQMEGGADILGKLADRGFGSEAVPTKTSEGDDAIVLKIGKPGSVAFYAETTVLPAKGYATYSAVVKVRGAVVSNEQYRGFVRTSAGIWLPTRILREKYALDKDQVPYLASKEEAVAFEPPRTDVPLSPEIFELASSREFKAARLSTQYLPQASPYLAPRAGLGARSSSFPWRMIALLANAIILAVLAAWWYRRRRAAGRN